MEYKKDIVLSRVKSLLQKSENVIYARKTFIQEVSSKDSSTFLNNNHLQGAINSSIRYGLYYNNELVSLITFGKLRKNLNSKNEPDSYELYRFCNKLNHSIVGGFSKLLKYALKNNNIKKLITYANRDWSVLENNMYEKNGFKFFSETVPSYFYFRYGDLTRYNRFSLRKDVLVSKGYDSNLSEKEILTELGFFRVYNTGDFKFEYLP